MTREESIAILDGFKHNPLFNEQHFEALDMAISALSENKGDLISRQAVENITWEEPSYTDPLNVLTEVREKVRALPSVENKGEWIDEGFYAEGHSEHAYRCSECGEHYIGYVGEFKFCPNCGADMRGE